MRDGGRDRAEADPLDDAEPSGELDDVGRERAPAVVGLRADEDEQVALVEPRPAQDELGPGQLGQAPVDDLERWPAGSIVEQLVRVEGRHGLRVVGQDAERGRRRRAGIDPAVEGGDHDRRDQLRGVVEGVQAHRRRIGDGPT